MRYGSALTKSLLARSVSVKSAPARSTRAFSAHRRTIVSAFARAALFASVGIALTACGSTISEMDTADINTKTKFSSKAYGVSASKRVTTSRKVAKGGGSFKLGKPYKVRGRWYTPKEDTDYDKKGLASWYGPNFHGRKTANGEIYDQYHLSAAHPTFPLPSYARVTNTENGHSVVVRVNDRGPFEKGRIIDVSSKAADVLEMKQNGLAKVRVQYVGRARMDGHDMAYLSASYKKNGRASPLAPDVVPDDSAGASGVMLAMRAPQRAISTVFGRSVETASLSQKQPRIKMASLSSDASMSESAFSIDAEVGSLPQTGPVPTERPSFVRTFASGDDLPASTVSSYAQMRVEQQSDTPFALVLSQPQLTGTMIFASWKRQGN